MMLTTAIAPEPSPASPRASTIVARDDAVAATSVPARTSAMPACIIRVGPSRSTSIPANRPSRDRGRLKAVPRRPAAARLRPRAPTSSGRRGGYTPWPKFKRKATRRNPPRAPGSREEWGSETLLPPDGHGAALRERRATVWGPPSGLVADDAPRTYHGRSGAPRDHTRAAGRPALTGPGGRRRPGVRPP